MGNVISMMDRLKKRMQATTESTGAIHPDWLVDGNASTGESSSEVTAESGDESVLNMTARREAIIESERRQVKRTILTEFVSAFAVVPRQGLLKVTIHDLSIDGIAFDLGIDKGQLQPGEQVAMRVYLNQHTYFPFEVQLRNVREISELGVHRHGGSFEKQTINQDALFHFVRFIETVSAALRTDHGDVLVSNLNSW